MNKYFRHGLLVLSTSLLIGCGGGGGTSGEENPLSTILASEIAQDNSMYAWHINNNIDNSFKINYSIDDSAHIFMPTTTSSNKIRVAIIDEDFEVTHPDIVDKVYATYNIMNGSTDVSVAASDEYSHGTAVAGLIGSTYLGVSPDNVELILINIDLGTVISESYFLEAFNKAQELGAQVINCSWGGSEPSQAFSDKVQEMKDAGINVVFAAGNNALNLDIFDDESELESVIGVGATSVSNDVTTYSNYGSAMDILAPGGDTDIGILSLDQLASDGYNPYPDPNLFIEGNDLVTNNYSFTVGTSFASPVISGVIALMLSENPNLTPEEIRTILISTTDKVGTNANYVDDGSGYTFDTYRAYGKVNASAAIQAAIDAIP